VALAIAALVAHPAEPDSSGDAAPATPPVTAVASLPTVTIDLPRRLDLDTAAATPLSTRTVRRARALAQPRADEASVNAPVLVLAEDSSWRRLDVGDLRATTDASGNPQPVLDTTSLAGDGRRAAFAQRDEVVVVDLTTAGVRRIRVPGFNEDVAWLGGRLLVTQEAATYLVDGAGAPAKVPYPGRDVLLPTGSQAGVQVVQLSIGGDGHARLRHWRGNTGDDERVVSGVADLVSWSGPGWQQGQTAARTVWISSGPASAPSGPPAARVLLVDTATGAGRIAADLGDPARAGASVLGWHDATSLLLNAGGQILVYEVQTGTAAVAATVGGGPAVLALAGGR
jgi:hypothetical protein